jgi:3-hydroxy acid dehydrogenase / malonic semialdehyde reductase
MQHFTPFYMQASKQLGKTVFHILRSPPLLSSPVRAVFTSIRAMATSASAKRLDGKTILITGASSGIGRSTAIEFARTSPQNLKIILTARRVDKLNEIAAEIKAELGDGVKVLPVQLDVSKADEIRNFVSSLPEEFKDINVLVNNA